MRHLKTRPKLVPLLCITNCFNSEDFDPDTPIFGPFRIVEHPPTQDVMPKALNYEAFAEEEYDGKRVLENAVDVNTYKQFLRQQCLPGLLARGTDDEVLDRNFGTSRSVPLNNSTRGSSSDYNRTRNYPQKNHLPHPICHAK